MREEEVSATEEFRRGNKYGLAIIDSISGYHFFASGFRCLNAAAAKHACGPTRNKESVEDNVCIAPAYGAQAALVRWCAVHERHGCAQALA